MALASTNFQKSGNFSSLVLGNGGSQKNGDVLLLIQYLDSIFGFGLGFSQIGDTTGCRGIMCMFPHGVEVF